MIQLFSTKGLSIITDDLTDNVLFMMSVAVGSAVWFKLIRAALIQVFESGSALLDIVRWIWSVFWQNILFAVVRRCERHCAPAGSK
jgi:hypothetical protein